jgi:hypothetical protein
MSFADTGVLVSGLQAASVTLAPAFVTWQNIYFTPAEMALIATADPQADPDADGLPNLLEYALGQNPRVRLTAPAMGSELVNVGDVSYLALTFDRLRDPLALGYAIEASSDLRLPWQTVTPVLANGYERIQLRDTEPVGGQARFLRVRATLPSVP